MNNSNNVGRLIIENVKVFINFADIADVRVW